MLILLLSPNISIRYNPINVKEIWTSKANFIVPVTCHDVEEWCAARSGLTHPLLHLFPHRALDIAQHVHFLHKFKKEKIFKNFIFYSIKKCYQIMVALVFSLLWAYY